MPTLVRRAPGGIERHRSDGQEPSGLTEERLASLYDAEGFGSEKTMQAKVIRELIDEIRVLRARQSREAPRPFGEGSATIDVGWRLGRVP